MSKRMRMYLQVFAGLAIIFILMLALASQASNCETPAHSRGDVVTHRLTGERAIIASSFCTGSAEGRHRAYRVSTGNETGDQIIFWGQFEITH